MRAYKRVLPWLALIAALIIYFVFYYSHIAHILDSDMSSELVLGRLLASEHRIVTNSWFYSTEIRILDTNIIYGLLFIFANSFATVRLLAAPLMILIFCMSFYYMCRSLKLREYYPYLMSLILLPFTVDYIYVYLMGFYYIFHAAIVFMCIGLLASKAKKGLLYVLALVAGASGLRLLVILFVPLLIIAIVSWVKKNFTSTNRAMLIASFFALVGYGINCLLALYISFRQFGRLRLEVPSIGKLRDIGVCFITSLGYRKSNPSYLVIVIALIIYLVALYRMRANTRLKEDGFALIYVKIFVIALALEVLIFAFTNMDMLSRYFLQVMLMAVVFIAYAHKYLIASHKVAGILLIVVFVLWVPNTFISYRDMAKRDTVSRYEPIVEYIEANGFCYGYSEFWDGNIITELTDGQVDMYTFSFLKEDLIRDNHDIYRWLQLTSHQDTRPAGPVFVLVSKQDTKHIIFFEKLKLREADYETSDYLLYTFESVDELEAYIDETDVGENTKDEL